MTLPYAIHVYDQLMAALRDHADRATILTCLTRLAPRWASIAADLRALALALLDAADELGGALVVESCVALAHSHDEFVDPVNIDQRREFAVPFSAAAPLGGSPVRDSDFSSKLLELP